ncbi:MAG: hypothetical protein J7577_00790 [Sphingobacteriaceae bacterium]|nr:hypothetical protein [Sphingobacteriaceae bacterium]
MNRQLDKIARRQENKGARVFFTALKSQIIKAASFISNGGSIDRLTIDATPIRSAIINFNYNVQTESAKWQYADLRKNNPIKASIGTGVSTELIRLIQVWILNNTGDRITKINDTTLDRIRSIHAAAFEQGLGPREIGALIRRESTAPFTVHRSTMIARTESTRNASQGHKFGAEAWEKETGQKKWKQWSATNDSRTRDAHRAMLTLQVVRGDQKFTVGGAQMEYPGDPAGGARNCVNCRCRVYYISERIAKRLLGEVKPAPADPRIPINLDEYEKRTRVKVDRTIFQNLNEIIPMTNTAKGSHYDPNTKVVNLQIGDRAKKSRWQAEKVVYHEYGHAIDWQKGMRMDGEVTALMNEFRAILSKNKNAGYKELHDKFYDDIKIGYKTNNHDEIEKITSFADTLMSLNPNFGAGHTKAYFNIEYTKEAEFIAHAFENKFLGNSYFEKIAPELYKAMIVYIEKYL